MEISALGRILADYLDSHGESLSGFARRAGVDVGTIRGIVEGGSQTLRDTQFGKVAEAMKMPRDQLVSEMKRVQGLRKMELPADLVGMIEARATLKQKSPADWLRDLIESCDSLRTKRPKKDASTLKLIHTDASQKAQPSEEAPDGSASAKSR